MITDELFRPLQAPDPDGEDPIAAWRGANAEATRAYERWRDAAPERRSESYCVYLAAADREGAAVEVLRMSAATASELPLLSIAA
jgi:hypothetical protein